MRAALHILLVLALWPCSSVAQEGGAWDAVRKAYDRGRVYAGIRKCGRELSGKVTDHAFLVLRAEGHNRIGEHGKAAADARAALSQVSGEPSKRAALQLGIAQAGMGWPDSARIWLERALGGTEDGEAHHRIGMLDKAAGNCVAAIASFDRALVLQPGRTNTLRERGGCHAALGDTAAAGKDIGRALELAPRDPANWNSRGHDVHARAGRWAEAVADYGRAIKLDPNYSYAFNNRGWAHHKLGDDDKALRDIRLAGRKKRNNPYVHRNLGMIALENGDKGRACAHFSDALGLRYTALHGPEVEELFRTHCGTPPPVPDPPNSVPTRLPGAMRPEPPP